jgi:hypothetical protein
MKYAQTSDIHGSLFASRGLPDNRIRASSATKPVEVR